jgi:NAD(P)-dependent dehydrogenase (short-subunit alcohol dehydrogenase family)
MLAVANLEGRVALVTGAGRGIGRATALALSSLGAQVMCVSRTESELQRLSQEFALEYVVETVATEEGCARIVDQTRRRLGPVDILINNAGVGSYRDRPIWEMTNQVWEESIATNLNGPFYLTRRVVKDMRSRQWGRIVMVASTAAQFAWPRMSSYCASKHGVLGLMRAVAQDVAPYNVTCNAVLPGWVRTRMADKHAEADARKRGVQVERIWEEWAAESPAGRIVAAEEVADAITFLVSDGASGINGDAITVALGGT